MPKKTLKKQSAPPVQSRIFKKIALTFLLVTSVLLGVVLYLSLSKAVIDVIPKQLVASTEFVIDVVRSPVSPEDYAGEVLTVTVEGSGEFNISEEGAKAFPAKAGGEVTIKNESGRDQPLVATTRLLSESGVLFRIDNSVTVPAGGEVKTMAHADLEGADGEISPTRFTIPGLSESLQKVIYATSAAPMTGGTRYQNVLTEADLDRAGSSLADQLFTTAQADFEQKLGSRQLSGSAFSREIVLQKSDTQVGEEAEKFKIQMTLKVVGVYFDRDKVLATAEAKLYESVPSGFDLIKVNRDGLVVSLQNFDVEAGQAKLSVTLDGVSIVSLTSQILNREIISGLTAGEVQEKLESAEAIENVDIDLRPFWLRRAPRLKDHIEIRILVPRF